MSGVCDQSVARLTEKSGASQNAGAVQLTVRGGDSVRAPGGHQERVASGQVTRRAHSDVHLLSPWRFMATLSTFPREVCGTVKIGSG